MKYRSPLTVFLLSLVTLGIYDIYWLYDTRREILQYHRDKQAIPSVLVLFIPILSIIALLLLYAVINNITGSTATSSSPSILNILLFAGSSIAIIAAIVVPFVWYYRYTKAVDVIGSVPRNLFLYFVLLSIFGVGVIWYAIAQSALNAVSQASLATPESSPAQPTPLI